jgi:hypothetical protein
MLLCCCCHAHLLPSTKLIHRCSTTVDKQQAEATTADNEQQVDATMMGTTATDDYQPAAAEKAVTWQCGPIGPPNSAAL